MTPFAALLLDFWRAFLTHLWQGTLVLALLFLLSPFLRRAPARLAHRFWTLGLIKLVVPVGLGGAVLAALGLDGSKAATIPGLRIAGALVDPARNLDPAGAQDAALGAGVLTLSAIYAAGVAWSLFRLGRDLGASRRRAGRPLEAWPAGMTAGLRRTAVAAGVPASRLRLAEEPVMPAVVGLWRPVVVIPRHLAESLSPDELRGVLLHEDAHRRRRDPLRNLLHRIAAALLFFYPLLPPLLRRLRETAEMACDERAVRTGVPSTTYATALARTVRLGLTRDAFAPAAWSGERSLLRRRFDRLTTPRRYAMRSGYRLVLATAVLILAAGFLAPFTVTADDAKQTEESYEHPVPLKQVSPEYPDEARRAGLQGTVFVKVVVSAEGKVVKVAIERGVEDAPMLGEAAVEAAGQWVFQPARENGKPVETEIVIPFKFALDEKGRKEDADQAPPKKDTESKD